jgi:hypothetical protein
MQIFLSNYNIQFFFSSPRKIRQMKAGQNNKYDITKTSHNEDLPTLAYMATSGGHFSRPSGMGSIWS